jgi:hypothetical protein
MSEESVQEILTVRREVRLAVTAVPVESSSILRHCDENRASLARACKQWHRLQPVDIPPCRETHNGFIQIALNPPGY